MVWVGLGIAGGGRAGVEVEVRKNDVRGEL